MAEDHQLEAEVAWAAGLFDGEGCIRMNKVGAKILTVEMLDPQATRKLQRLLGGKLYKFVRRDSGKTIYRWQTNGQATIQALQQMLPWLTTKQAEAQELLRYAAFQRDNDGGRCRSRSARVNKELGRTRERLSRLKRRAHQGNHGATLPSQALPLGATPQGDPMPAKSKAQLRKAHAACEKGEKWGCEMAEKTKSTKGLPERKGKKGK